MARKEYFMKIKKKRLAIIIAAMLLIAFAVFNSAANKASAKASNETLSKEIEYAVSKDNISISVSESGSVNPTDKRVIKSEIDGTADAIYVTEGDLVEKDQVLISLNSDTAKDNRSEIDDIELNIEKARRELDDLYKKLFSLYMKP